MLFTNMKSHWGLRLVPKSWMTLNGVMAIFCVNSSKAVAFTSNYVKSTKATAMLSTTKMLPKESSFWFL